tara:strand:+ start:274 stop:609 length:336 start_codon:yes stop_codon:yes gene_type:complete
MKFRIKRLSQNMKKFQNPFIVSLLFFIVSCSGNNSINDIKTLEQKALEIPPNFDLKPPLDIEQDLIDNELDSVESNEDLKEILETDSSSTLNSDVSLDNELIDILEQDSVN